MHRLQDELGMSSRWGRDVDEVDAFAGKQRRRAVVHSRIRKQPARQRTARRIDVRDRDDAGIGARAPGGHVSVCRHMAEPQDCPLAQAH